MPAGDRYRRVRRHEEYWVCCLAGRALCLPRLHRRRRRDTFRHGCSVRLVLFVETGQLQAGDVRGTDAPCTGDRELDGRHLPPRP